MRRERIASALQLPLTRPALDGQRVATLLTLAALTLKPLQLRTRRYRRLLRGPQTARDTVLLGGIAGHLAADPLDLGLEPLQVGLGLRFGTGLRPGLGRGRDR